MNVGGFLRDERFPPLIQDVSRMRAQKQEDVIGRFFSGRAISSFFSIFFIDGINANVRTSWRDRFKQFKEAYRYHRMGFYGTNVFPFFFFFTFFLFLRSNSYSGVQLYLVLCIGAGTLAGVIHG